ncbi:hypothetical protein KIPB_006615 [Kipferlia bialata]|uniref:Uncharacterized protein n=1 Tax=Kipferlia bialata TaxID=797122 RepID=A0A391NWS9_9EUKA|nr:hypothetical protein KIPB_006615 [Kipferlia bialata]|eukprot:g6615.t1
MAAVEDLESQSRRLLEVSCQTAKNTVEINSTLHSIRSDHAATALMQHTEIDALTKAVQGLADSLDQLEASIDQIPTKDEVNSLLRQFGLNARIE